MANRVGYLLAFTAVGVVATLLLPAMPQPVEHHHFADGRTLFGVANFLLVGTASVLYWRVTEQAGVGNVMPYGVLQVYAVVIVVLIALLYPSRYTHSKAIFSVNRYHSIPPGGVDQG